MTLGKKRKCSLWNYKNHICDSLKTEFKHVSSTKAEDLPSSPSPPSHPNLRPDPCFIHAELIDRDDE